jgi:hypothetical protein
MKRKLLLLSLIAIILQALPVSASGLFETAMQQIVIVDEDGPDILRERYVHVNVESIQNDSQSIELDLFDDTRLIAQRTQYYRTRGGGEIWIGTILGREHSNVFLSVREGILIGNISYPPDNLYQIRYVDDSIHVIRSIDPSTYAPEADPGEVRTPPVKLDDSKIFPLRDDGSIINVLVVYTEDARIAVGGTAAIQALIDLAIAETNTSYSNSNIVQRLNLVPTQEVSYTETGEIWTDRNRLRDPLDGYLDEVHDLRDCHRADVVSLIVADGGEYCGISYIMKEVNVAFEDSAFCVVVGGCATANYSFGHELGHIMSARHDWYVDDTINSPYTYNHGYVNTEDSWRTVMAYNDQCDDGGSYCLRLPYWSNPFVSYEGDATGVIEGTSTACIEQESDNPDCDAENWKTLNNTASTVANFRHGGGPVVHVPADQPTIQAGIDAACVGDEVIVSCGTYYEYSIVMKSGVHLRSETGEAECVTIDAQWAGRVFYCDDIDSNSSIMGFTIKHGRASGIILNQQGGGIYCRDSHLEVTNCIFKENMAQGGSAAVGGGAYCLYSSPTFENCEFIGNQANGQGGGVISTNYSSPSFFNCQFRGNQSDDNGGGMCCSGDTPGAYSPTLTGCTFEGNQGLRGSGLYCYSDGSPTLVNCTFSGNQATGHNGSGTITCTYNSYPTLTNCIIAYGDNGEAIDCSYASEPTLICCDIFGNEDGDWVDCIADQYGLNGNISTDPRFCDPENGDLSLRSDSPCAPENNDCGELLGAWPVGCSSVEVHMTNPQDSDNLCGLVTFAAEVIGTPPEVVHVGFYFDGEQDPRHTDDTSPYSYTVDVNGTVEPGAHIVVAEAILEDASAVISESVSWVKTCDPVAILELDEDLSDPIDECGRCIYLSAEHSSDDNDDPQMTFEFTCLTTDNYVVTQSAPTDPTVKICITDDPFGYGTYTFHLLVTDGWGLADEMTLDVDINDICTDMIAITFPDPADPCPVLGDFEDSWAMTAMATDRDLTEPYVEFVTFYYDDTMTFIDGIEICQDDAGEDDVWTCDWMSEYLPAAGGWYYVHAMSTDGAGNSLWSTPVEFYKSDKPSIGDIDIEHPNGNIYSNTLGPHAFNVIWSDDNTELVGSSYTFNWDLNSDGVDTSEVDLDTWIHEFEEFGNYSLNLWIDEETPCGEIVTSNVESWSILLADGLHIIAPAPPGDGEEPEHLCGEYCFIAEDTFPPDYPVVEDMEFYLDDESAYHDVNGLDGWTYCVDLAQMEDGLHTIKVLAHHSGELATWSEEVPFELDCVPTLLSWMNVDTEGEAGVNISWEAEMPDDNGEFSLFGSCNMTGWDVSFREIHVGYYEAVDRSEILLNGGEITYSLYYYDDMDQELLLGEERIILEPTVMRTELLNVYPNPTNPSVSIVFILESDQLVRVTILDIAGRRIRQLAESFYPRGRQQVVWRGDDTSGNPVSSGVYFVHMDAKGYRATKKVVLLR